MTGYVLDASIQTCNPGIHEIIRELRENTWGLPCYDAFAVGEAGGVSSRNAAEFLEPSRKELETLYHFQIVSRNRPTPTLVEYKAIQKEWGDLFNRGIWTTQHLSNHDQARQATRFGNDSPLFRKSSAKCLALLTHVMPGTPFVYQGEEIGMTNVSFDSIDDYNDRYTLGGYAENLENGMTKEEALQKVRFLSRDNARTPMQWDGRENAGFTAAGIRPWMRLNPDYPEINVEKDRTSADSVFAFYQKLIALRKDHGALITGEFSLYMEEDPHFVVVTRTLPEETLLLIANPTNERATLTLPDVLSEKLPEKTAELLLGTASEKERTELSGIYEPWEGVLYRL